MEIQEIDWQQDLLNFVGYCDLASLKKVYPENKKLWPENTGQPKSARAFCCLGHRGLKLDGAIGQGKICNSLQVKNFQNPSCLILEKIK